MEYQVRHFSIQHLTAMAISTQSGKVEDKFDTVERLETNLTQRAKVEVDI